MHKQGASAWFSDGREERETILKMGAPWKEKFVVEFGCGEGDLGAALFNKVKKYIGVDYSREAIETAIRKHPHIYPAFILGPWMNLDTTVLSPFNTIIMQGVLEHLDDPFGELQWMIEHFKPKTVITSSPCFLNTRGVVWMTLNMLGAVMSKTDLHYLSPWDFEIFCEDHNYKLRMQDCDWEWGNGGAMIEDLSQRIPLALKDGGLPEGRVKEFMEWLLQIPGECKLGATMVYRIDI